MGLFELQRELAVESAQKERTAKTRAEALGADPASLVEQVLASDLDPKIVEPLYRKLATKDETVALAVARLDARSAESNRALFEENIELLAPLLAARLRTDAAAHAAQLLGNAGKRAASALPALRQAVRSKARDASLWSAWAVAQIGVDEDLPLVAEIAGAKPPWQLTVALAKRGVPAFVEAGVEKVRRWLDARNKKVDSDDADGIGETIDALGDARSEIALPVLHDAMVTPLARQALGAIAKIAHPSSREHIDRFLALLAGGREENWPHRLPAEDALRAIAPRAAWPPLDTAREVLAYIHPRRYAWPKIEDVPLYLVLAARALRLQGDARDLEAVARLANAQWIAVRAEGALAWEKVHGEKPAIAYWDDVRVQRALKKTKPAALLEIATSPTTVFRHNVVRALAKTKDPKTQRALADHAREELEARPNHRVDYYERSDMGEEPYALLDALGTLAKKAPAIKKSLASTTSLWIRHQVLGQEINPSEWPTGVPEPPPPLLASVKKLGARAQGSFAVGRHTNALAYSNDGTRLAAVGSELGVILDADTGETHVELELRYNWGYGAVFSNDDKHLYVAYHGGHVEQFDAETGKTLRSFEGHGGVPNGVRGIALSPDGKRLLTAGSDGRAFLWELPSGKVLRKWTTEQGTFYGTAFSPDGKRFALSQLREGKKGSNAVFVGDAKTGKATSFETPTSMWALAFAKNGALVCAGEGKQILFSNENFKPTRKLGQGDVVRVEFADGDKTLVAISQNGEAKAWDIASGKAKKLAAVAGSAEGGTAQSEMRGPLWALARNPKDGTLAMAGTAGVIHRFDKDLVKLGGEAALAMHTGQARGFAVLRDGRFFTCGWDGRLLLWAPSGTRVVHQLDVRMTELALTDDERHLIVLHNKGCLCFDAQTLAVTGRYEPKITNSSVTNPESLAVSGEVVAVGHWGGSVRTFAVPSLEPLGNVSLGKSEIEVMTHYGDGFLCGTDDGRIVALSSTLDVLWTMPGFASEEVERAKSVTALAVHDKILAAGQSARIFDLSGHAPVMKKRFLTGGGLFNNLVFSPSGARLIVPTGWTFEVYDATIGTLLAKLERKEFPGADELTRAEPISEDEILVGAENGSIYQVTLK